MGITYQQLNHRAGEIRIVDLEPSLEHEAEVCLKIRHAPLTGVDCGEYEALSYTSTWGDTYDTTTIRVDGFEMQVTRNLDTALRYLRRPANSRILWVDAVCVYSYRTKIKHLRILRFVPLFYKGFHFCRANHTEIPG